LNLSGWVSSTLLSDLTAGFTLGQPLLGREERRGQWCIAKNGGGYTQRGVATGLKVPCLFTITEVSIRCQKNPGGWYAPYTRAYLQYTTGCGW